MVLPMSWVSKRILSLVGLLYTAITRHVHSNTTAGAQADLRIIYNGLMARAASGSATAIGTALDGLTLTSGVYVSPSYLVNGAQLTFDAQGDSSSVWVIVR